LEILVPADLGELLQREAIDSGVFERLRGRACLKRGDYRTVEREEMSLWDEK